MWPKTGSVARQGLVCMWHERGCACHGDSGPPGRGMGTSRRRAPGPQSVRGRQRRPAHRLRAGQSVRSARGRGSRAGRRARGRRHRRAGGRRRQATCARGRMRRGEIWTYTPALSDGTPLPRRSTVVLVSDPAVIGSPYRWVHEVPVVQNDPGHVLGVYTDYGWVDALELHRAYRPWLSTHVGMLTAEETEALDASLRATLSL